jgi:hypothetical protein
MSDERFDAIDARLERANATAERTVDNIAMLTQQIGLYKGLRYQVEQSTHRLGIVEPLN